MNYVNNKALLAELKIYKDSGKISDELGKMFILIATNLSKKSNWCAYTYRSDMVSEAILTIVKYIHNFNPEKSNNPFAYITQICTNSFKAFVKKEHKASDIKDVCYKEINNFQNQEDIWVNKGIDYTIFVKDKKRENFSKRKRVYK